MLCNEQREKSIFVILTEQRSGSHYLKGLLNSHPKFFCDKEWFSKKSGVIASFSNKVVAQTSHEELERLLLNHYNERHGCADVIHVGSIIHGHQLDSHVLKFIRKTVGLKVIVLHRKNLLARLVSKKIARARSIFTSKSTPDQETLPKVNITYDELSFFSKRASRRLDLIERYLTENRTKWMKVYYEDLCSTKETVMKSIFDFFCEEDHPTSTKILKQVTRPLPDSIANYIELRASLSNSEYSEYLN